MRYIEFCIETTTEGAELISGIFHTRNMGVSIEDEADIVANQREEGAFDYIDEHILDYLGGNVLVKAYFEDDERLSGRLEEIRGQILDTADTIKDVPLGTLDMRLRTVGEEDWANEWKKYYKPFEVGKKLLVKPTWEHADAGGRIVIELDPGAAFGTGTHETTFMCMELLEEIITPGMDIIDIGCGSGILAITAVKLGARHAAAIDRDPTSVKVSKANAETAGVSGSVDVFHGDLLDKHYEKADVIVANIIADAIIQLAPDVPGVLKRGGLFVSSGIILERLDEVTRAIEAAGFVIQTVSRKGGWAAILAELRQ